MGKLARTLSHGLGRVRRGPGKLGRALRRQWRAWRIAQADRAHLATTGDRPFPGCNPREAGRSTSLAPSGSNPAAMPRPKAPREVRALMIGE